MRILVVGAGATGGYFGGRMARAGRDVTFLVRPKRAELLREHGLTIVGPDGTREQFPVKTVTTAELGEAFDLIVLSVKAYGLEQAMADIAPAVGEGTMILPFLNGMRHLDTLRSAFGGEHVIGGLCRIAATLGPDGEIVQMGAGASVAYGEFDGTPSPRLKDVDAAMAGAGFDTSLSADIELDMWEKWLMLAAGGALTTLMRGPVGEIEASPGGKEAALGIIGECVAVIEACGASPREAFVEQVTRSLTKPGSPTATSMYRDQAAGNPVEADQIVGDLVARGEKLGVPVVRLSLAYTALGVYQRGLAGATR